MTARQLFYHHLNGHYMHPTALINALVELENSDGVAGLRQFYSEVTVMRQQLQLHQPGYSPATAQACEAWYAALHAYIYQYGLETRLKTDRAALVGARNSWHQRLGAFWAWPGWGKKRGSKSCSHTKALHQPEQFNAVQ